MLLPLVELVPLVGLVPLVELVGLAVQGRWSRRAWMCWWYSVVVLLVWVGFG